MTGDTNPLGREYNRAEVAAARRIGLARTDTVWEGAEPRKVLGGPIIYATGPYWPDRARAMARDWAIVANALDREWNRNTEEPSPSSPAPLDVESFNAAHPVGTEVLFWPGAKNGVGRRSHTRTPAWDLSGHAVVSVDDHSGGVALSHIETLDGPPRDTIEESELGGPAGVLGYLYKCVDCGWAVTDPNPVVIGACPHCRGRMSRRWTENP